MKPMFGYFGSKYKLAKHYGRPQRDLVIEPFAGSACFSLYHEPKQVILVDKYPVVCAIWRYLISVHEHEILALPVYFDHVDELKVCEEAKLLLGFWIGNGMSRPLLKKTPWGKQYVDDPQVKVWGDAAKIRIACNLKKIRHWKLIEGCYTSIPDYDAHWFIDPPYFDKGGKYPMNEIDYPHLAQWCKSRRGVVQVCEQQGADWLPFKEFRNVESFHSPTESGKRMAKMSNEVLYQQ